MNGPNGVRLNDLKTAALLPALNIAKKNSNKTPSIRPAQGQLTERITLLQRAESPTCAHGRQLFSSTLVWLLNHLHV